MLRPSFCRFCTNGCPILVEVEDGRAVRVTGDPSNDIYQGYTCVKGRALPEQHNHPERLLHSQKRLPDGSFQPIASAQLMDEVAARISEIVDRHGPQSVAFYYGTMIVSAPTAIPVIQAFTRAIGSSMVFTPNTIDRPGKYVATALLGRWQAPIHDFDDPDVSLMVGANPFVSYSAGLPFGHPGKWLERWKERGYDVIVIDPRRSDIAKRATIHLQPRPGEDASILAGMLRVIITEDLHDHAFVAEDVEGVERLAAAVAPFTPEYVARRCDIVADDLIAAARLFASGTRGVACAGTGPNMSGPGTVVEYLIQCLNTVCGRWFRAGERVRIPPTIVSPKPMKAQATPPVAGFALTDPLPGTNLTGSAAGLPVSAVPDAILHGGDDRIRAFISFNGNPAAAWPDQIKTVDAMRALDLLVQIDISMSNTAQLAHYVVAPKMSLETPGSTLTQETLGLNLTAIGHGEPWAQYTDAIVDPPAGSDLLEEWEFVYGLAQRMELQLELNPFVPWSTTPPIALDMEHPPTSAELLELYSTGSRISFEELRRHPHGAVFAEHEIVVAPKDPDCTARLDVGNPVLLGDLEQLALESLADDDPVLPTGERLEYRLLCRRLQQSYNSSGLRLQGMRKRPYNPAFMHPDDLARLGLAAGDTAEIRSARAAITAIVEPDETLRRGLVSMTHGFGSLPGSEDDVRRVGANTGQLLSMDEKLQPYTGQPIMSNVPVSVRAAATSEVG